MMFDPFCKVFDAKTRCIYFIYNLPLYSIAFFSADFKGVAKKSERKYVIYAYLLRFFGSRLDEVRPVWKKAWKNNVHPLRAAFPRFP